MCVVWIFFDELYVALKRFAFHLAVLVSGIKPFDAIRVFFAGSQTLNKLEKTVANDFEIIVRFKEEAVAITTTEREQLREALQPIVASGKSVISVEVPAGFSEAKRMGFYRALAVRNLLLEMKMPKDSIDVSVREGKNNANAAIVKVRLR